MIDLAPLKKGDKIWFEGERLGYTVQARDKRYLVCTKPFNPRRTVLYCIVDSVKNIRGPEGLVFGFGAETPHQCLQMLRRVSTGHTDISYRRAAPLKVVKVLTHE